MRRTETPEPIWIKFCMMVDIADIFTYTNFGDHRLRGFWVAGGQISPSPIDFHRRPYNTLTLPCERVIIINSTLSSAYRFERIAVENLSVFSSTTLNFISKLNSAAEFAFTREMRDRLYTYSNAFLSCYNASTPCFCTTLCQLTGRTYPTF